MGARIAKYSFIPKANQQIEASITLKKETRSAIHGVVRDERGRYVKDAVVKLFCAKDCEDGCALKSITHTITDECGQFIFGPLTPGKRYVIKVWVDDIKLNTGKDIKSSGNSYNNLSPINDKYAPRRKPPGW